MPEQILLQGKIFGVEEFLCSRSDGLISRAQWITLLSEVLPRAVLAELGLPQILLGSSGGGQFLLVLPEGVRHAAEETLVAAARQIAEMSGEELVLLWSITENLGDWSVIRKRLGEEMQRKLGTPLAGGAGSYFEPEQARAAPNPFDHGLGETLRETSVVGWSPEAPGAVTAGAGKHTWRFTSSSAPDGISIARHAAPSDDGRTHASVQRLASRAKGRPIWGVLRGDVDHFGPRLRRLHTIEEHVQFSVLYKQFFAGELEVLCSLPEFWRKISILYSGGNDFAVYGSWDALIGIAREMQRLFRRFVEENLKDFPGPEAKTISMAVALAIEADTPLAAVYRQAGCFLEAGKAANKDCLYLFGRILDWKQVAHAAELKDMISRLPGDVRRSRPLVTELRRQSGSDPRRWRLLTAGATDREFQKLRTHLVNEILGRDSNETKVRPAGLVAMEWAQMAAEV